MHFSNFTMKFLPFCKKMYSICRLPFYNILYKNLPNLQIFIKKTCTFWKCLIENICSYVTHALFQLYYEKTYSAAKKCTLLLKTLPFYKIFLYKLATFAIFS